MTELWAVHTIGPDDLHPCASRRLAVRNATWLNLSLANRIPDLDEAAEPLVYNIPVIWDGFPKAHALLLAEEERLDVRWSDVHTDPIGDLTGHLCLDSRNHGAQ